MSTSAKPAKKVPKPPPTPGPTVSRVDRDFGNDGIITPSNDQGTPIVDWTISGTCRWMIDADGRLVFAPSSGSLGELEDWGYQGAPWDIYAESIRSVSFSGVIFAPTTYGMFFGCSSLASLDLSGLDTSSVRNMSWMFFGCSSLASLDLSGLDTSSVEDIERMFSGCSSLASLDLTGLDTSSVRNMCEMFHSCSSLASLDLSGLDTSSVESMDGMFSDCSSLASLDLSGLDTSSVEGIYRMFSGCSSLASLDLSALDTSSVAYMREMFRGCSSLTSLDLSALDTSSVRNMCEMFRGCSSLRAVAFGPKFKFEGAWWNRQSWLPTPSGDGLTGRWVSSADGIAYTPDDIPSNVAATYVAQMKDEAPKTAIAESTFAVGAATMALTEYPSCGNDVSAFASSCPNCGFPVVLYASMKGRVETQGDDPLELVAANPHTPIVILEMLCGNGNRCVRAALTRNPNTPENLLLQLADDENDDVRIALASSPYATIGVMEKLSDDADGDVIGALCQNPSTPEYIQRELERQLGGDANRSDDDFEYDDDYDGGDDGHERSSLDLSADDFGNQYYRYGDTYLPYHDGVIEYRGKCYDVMDGGGSGETMYFDEDNGWLTELP